MSIYVCVCVFHNATAPEMLRKQKYRTCKLHKNRRSKKLNVVVVRGIILLWHYVTILLWHYVTMILCYYDTMLLYYYGTMLPWYYVSSTTMN